MNPASLDIFCHVIDNFGDAGVVYRFAKELKNVYPHCSIRVFIDNLETLSSIVPAINSSEAVQEYQSITFINLAIITAESINQLGVAEVLVEAFACEIPDPVMDIAIFKSKLIINLEYLSAEEWVEGYHLKESLLNCGTAKKYFFMPGFTTETGGLILNSEVLKNKAEYRRIRLNLLNDLLQKYTGSPISSTENKLFGSVFSYQRGFDTLLKDLLEINQEIYLMVFGHKSHHSIKASLERAGIIVEKADYIDYHNIHICFMPFLSQERYDSLLCCCDFNLVRGEDSLVRALCAGKPFIWNAYLQENRYQQVKVDAFLKIFRQYFDDSEVFNRYKELLNHYNDALIEEPIQKTCEKFNYFFSDLNKIEHATAKMSYFIEENCNLVQRFSDFLREFKN